MINMLKLGFVARCCEWVFSGGASTPTVAWYMHACTHAHTCTHSLVDVYRDQCCVWFIACVCVCVCVSVCVCAAVWRRGGQRCTSMMGGAVARSWLTWTACTIPPSSSFKWVTPIAPHPSLHVGLTPRALSCAVQSPVRCGHLSRREWDARVLGWPRPCLRLPHPP